MNIILKVLFKSYEKFIPAVEATVTGRMDAENIEAAKDVFFSNMDYINKLAGMIIDDEEIKENDICNLIMLTDIDLLSRHSSKDENTFMVTYEVPFTYPTFSSFMEDDATNFESITSSMKFLVRLLNSFLKKEPEISSFELSKEITIGYDTTKIFETQSYDASVAIRRAEAFSSK